MLKWMMHPCVTTIILKGFNVKTSPTLPFEIA
jgi:hypothetical protein